MPAPLRPWLIFFAALGTASALSATEVSVVPVRLPPGPAIIQYATAQSIPLEKFELAGEGTAARPGDALTVLFTIQDGTGSRQWLGEFRAATLTERETKSKPGTGLGILSSFQTTLYTDTRHAFSFEQLPAAFEVRMHGPFSGDQPAPDTSAVTEARVLATRGYLAHGLAPLGEIELRLRAAGRKNPGLSFMFRAKYSAGLIAAAQARAAAAGFTEEDERVYAEGIFALVQFGNLSFLTKGVDTITHEIADSPTLFSGAFTQLDWTNLQSEDGAAWGLPGAKIFRVPYRFDSKTKARGDFYITAPRPPLQNLAGIVGLTVDETSKAPGKRLIMRVLAGRRAPAD